MIYERWQNSTALQKFDPFSNSNNMEFDRNYYWWVSEFYFHGIVKILHPWDCQNFRDAFLKIDGFPGTYGTHFKGEFTYRTRANKGRGLHSKNIFLMQHNGIILSNFVDFQYI